MALLEFTQAPAGGIKGLLPDWTRILEIGMKLTNQYILSIKIGKIFSYYSRF